MELDAKPPRQHLQPTRPALSRSDIAVIGATKTRWVKPPVLLSLLMRPAALKVELPIGSFTFLHDFGVICLKLARYLLVIGAFLAY